MYLVIGDGNVAAHFSHYFSLLSLPFQTWSRRADPLHQQLEKRIADSKAIFLLISDHSIDSFFREYLKSAKVPVLHCSGCYHFDGMISAHPLMTFSKALYDLPTYQQIPFAMTGAAYIQDVIPELKNASFAVSPEQKALYHALCVCSGNFIQLLTRLSQQEFTSRLGIDSRALAPYLEQSLRNILNNPETVTGPLVGKDARRISLHLQALNSSPLLPIYQTFVQTFFPEFRG